MSNLQTLLAIAVLQYLFQITRIVGMVFNVEGKMRESLFFTFVLQTLWLFSTYLGMISIMHGNWIAVGVYMIAGLIGNWQGIKIIQKRKANGANR